MLSLVARILPDRETVLLLEWQRGRVLALHDDGRLAEYPLDRVRVDLIEAKSRIVLNQKGNAELMEQAVE